MTTSQGALPLPPPEWRAPCSRPGCCSRGGGRGSRRQRRGIPRTAGRQAGLLGHLAEHERRRLRPRAARGPRQDAPPGAGVVDGGAHAVPAVGARAARRRTSRRARRPTHAAQVLHARRAALGLLTRRRSRSSSAPRDLTLVGQFGHRCARSIRTAREHPGRPVRLLARRLARPLGRRHARRRRRRLQRRDLARPRRQLPQRRAARRRALDAARRQHDRVPRRRSRTRRCSRGRGR